ncbi:MAG: DUF4846 domain-containing protein [Myxococcota bacterium]|nr:DUF4846 domain-containing protein [Myxococcota bacterium]
MVRCLKPDLTRVLPWVCSWLVGLLVGSPWLNGHAQGEPPSHGHGVGQTSDQTGPALRMPVIKSGAHWQLYPWMPKAHALPIRRLDNTFPTPSGYTRIEVVPGHFDHWLRGLPIRRDRRQVLSYRDRPLDRPAAGIVYMDVGRRDLQQCADSAIRLHAEYLWAKGFQHRLQYHFTSGDLSRWSDWKAGERFVIRGAEVARKTGPARSGSHQSFRAWLDLIFTYAGSLSLPRDTTVVGTKPYRAGDILVQGGRPGHVVMILDIARNRDGTTIALLGQGFMPAEDFHVLRDQGPHVIEQTWFRLPDEMDAPLPTPSWPSPFTKAQARRFHHID